MVYKIFVINGTGYELYQAASGDWCVTVDDGSPRRHYNLGSMEDALAFILEDYEVETE